MVATLETVLGAERRGGGLRDPETMLEVWVRRGNGDWVIVQNYANGTSCIVAMGEYWQDQSANPAWPLHDTTPFKHSASRGAPV